MERPRRTLIYPKVKGWGVHHSKFMLLFRNDGCLRVVITSANLIPSDWGVSLPASGSGQRKANTTLDNGVFVVDLPRRGSNEDWAYPQPGFQADLVGYLERAGLGRSLVGKIQGYDFSACAHIGFVSTRQVSPLPSCLRSVNA